MRKSNITILNGINIQYPWSQMLISGVKTIETRTYPLPEKHFMRPLALVETPGKLRNFKARIIGIIVFGHSKFYEIESEFYRDTALHRVKRSDSQYTWKPQVKKWGWKVEHCVPLPKYELAPQPRGIVFTGPININLGLHLPAHAELDPSI